MRALTVALLIIFAPAVIYWLFIRPVPLEVTVYFVREAGQEATLAPARRMVRARSPQSRLQEAYRALLVGPTAEERAGGLSTEIPAGTALRGIAVGGGIVVADFTADLERGGGSSSMQARVWQIVYTGTQFPAASRVRIIINSQPRAALGGEGVVIEEPLGRPEQPPTF